MMKLGNVTLKSQKKTNFDLQKKIVRMKTVQGSDKVYCKPGNLLEFVPDMKKYLHPSHPLKFQKREGGVYDIKPLPDEPGNVFLVLEEPGVFHRGNKSFLVTKTLFGEHIIYIHLLYPHNSMMDFFSLKVHATE